MKSLADAISTRGRNNNFLIIRLLAATAVVIGHSIPLAATPCADCVDPHKLLGVPTPLHGIGVEIFFLVSGFLITASAESNSIKNYLKSRALRIYPGLLFCLLIMAFVVGPAFTNMPLKSYLSSGDVYSYVTTPLAIFWGVKFELPGVRFTDAILGTSVNGSLWTIPIELRMYLAIAAAAILLKLARVPLRASITAILIALTLLYIYVDSFTTGTIKLAIFFFTGSATYIFRPHIPHSALIAAALLFIYAISASTPAKDLTFGISICYLTFYVAYCRTINLPAWIEDYSYGIYLYAFPIQQITASLLPWAEPYWIMAISIPASWIAGAISWKVIEKPFLSLKSRSQRSTNSNVVPSAGSMSDRRT